jgi:acetoin utilization protein AcuB
MASTKRSAKSARVAKAAPAATTAAAAKPVKSAKKKSPAKKSDALHHPLVRDFMSASPHSIGIDQTLELAHTMLRKHRIRHLPVLEGGKLVGILSQRDLYLVESLDATAPSKITVDDAMSPEVFSVKPTTHLVTAVREMVKKKYGCAVVVEKDRAIGVLTTTDALRALLEYAPKPA